VPTGSNTNSICSSAIDSSTDMWSAIALALALDRHSAVEGQRGFEGPKIDYIHWTGELRSIVTGYTFSLILAQRGARLGRSAMSDTTGSGSTAPDPATADNPPPDIGAGDQARDPEGSAAHQSDQRDAGITDDQMPAGDQGG
jgi:hypothetical protein